VTQHGGGSGWQRGMARAGGTVGRGGQPVRPPARTEHTPDIPRGVEVLDAGRLLTERLEILATRIGTTYRDRLDEPTLARLRAAVRQLQATADALTGLPEALGRTTTGQHPDMKSRSTQQRIGSSRGGDLVGLGR
jgi:hypothetical protein